MDKKKLNLFLLCSPNLGILDNWLPVLTLLKKSGSFKISVIFTKTPSKEIFISDNQVLQKSFKIFDNFFIYSNGQIWLEFKSIKEIISLKNNRLINLLIKLRYRIKRFKIANFLLTILIYFYETFKFSNYSINIKKINQKGPLLYDIHEEYKESNKKLMELFNGQKKYSICHGINIHQKIINNKKLNRNKKETTAFLFSKNEINYYSKSFNLLQEEMLVTGIPRHDKEWIKILRKEKSILKFNRYVILVSRSLSPFFTLERKLDALRSIRTVIIEKLSLKLVIKMHPKENDKNLYYDIFGKENIGINWSFTDEHIFVLSKNAIFSITFFSGVSIDLIKCKVPVLEFLSLSGIPAYDNEYALRDEKDKPVLDYRFLKLVKGIESKLELYDEANKILAEKNHLVNFQSNRFKKLFKQTNNASTSILQYIVKST